MGIPVHYGMIDKSGERSGTKVHFAAIAADGANWDETFTDAGTSTHDLVKAAIVTLTKLNMTRTVASIEVDQSLESLPSAADAQREWKLLFTWTTDLGDKGSFTIPAPVDAVVPTGTDVVNLDNVLVAAAIAVFEADLVSPGGELITITGCRVVGRNN